MLKHEGVNSSRTMIVLQSVNLTEEYWTLYQHVGNQTNFSTLGLTMKKWTPPEYGILKVNIDVAFTKDKIGICILVRNHLGTLN